MNTLRSWSPENRCFSHAFFCRVDFSPEVDHKGARRAMLRDHREMLGNFMFDGTMLFTTRLLQKPVIRYCRFVSIVFKTTTLDKKKAIVLQFNHV